MTSVMTGECQCAALLQHTACSRWNFHHRGMNFYASKSLKSPPMNYVSTQVVTTAEVAAAVVVVIVVIDVVAAKYQHRMDCRRSLG